MVHGGTHTHTHTHTHTQTQRDNQTTKTIGPHLFGAVGVDVAGPGRRNRVDWPDPPPNPFNPFTFFLGGGGLPDSLVWLLVVSICRSVWIETAKKNPETSNNSSTDYVERVFFDVEGRGGGGGGSGVSMSEAYFIGVWPAMGVGATCFGRHYAECRRPGDRWAGVGGVGVGGVGVGGVGGSPSRPLHLAVVFTEFFFLAY